MLNNGEISYENERWGKKERKIIDGSELARVFGSDFQPKETKETTQGNKSKQAETKETTIEDSLLKQQVTFLEEKVSDREKQLEEKNTLITNLSGKLDKAQVTIERQTYLLEYKQKSQPGEKAESFRKDYQSYLPAITVALSLFCIIIFGYSYWKNITGQGGTSLFTTSSRWNP